MTVRESFARAWGKIRGGFVRFGVFHVCMVAVAMLFALENHGLVGESAMLNLARGICWGALAGVFAQLVGEWRRVPLKKWIVAVITGVIGALGCWFWFSIGESSPRYWLWTMLYGGSFFSLAAASVAVLFAYSDERVLVPRLVLNALGGSGSAAIFTVSQMVCLLAFDKLVQSVGYRIYADVYGVSWILILSIGFISFLPGRERDDGSSDRATAFLFWLLLPAALLLLGILYLYLLKIVLLWSMPSGELNWFGSVALAAYAFFWLSLRGSSRGFFRFFARWGWAFLLPVLTAQVIGIVIRYQAYGLSTPRFAGMITLSFGIVVLILAALDRRPLELFVYMAVAGLVFTVSPLNVIDLPVRNQEARLRAALERNGLLKDGGLQLMPGVRIPERDGKIITGAWKYLVSDGAGHGDWWSDGLARGKVRPTVWHRPSFTVGMCKCLKTLGAVGKDAGDPLLRLLKMDKPELARNKKSAAEFVRMEFRLAGDGMLPIGGYSHFRALSNGPGVQCYRSQDRWVVQFALPGQKDWQTYDATECVERIFKASGCKGVIAKDLNFELTSAEAVWELRPNLALAIGGFSTSGSVGRKITNILLPHCVLMTKREDGQNE